MIFQSSPGENPSGRPAEGQKRPRRLSSWAWLLVASLTFLPQASQAVDHAPGPSPLPNPQKIPLSGPIHFQARNIIFHMMRGVHLQVRSVDAVLLQSSPNEPVTLEDPTSMRVKLLSGDTSISAEDMTVLLNDYALPQSHLPIHSVQVTFDNGDVLISGKVHKLIDLPFSAAANIGVTPHGNVHLHFYKITAAGVLHKELLDFFGMSIADIAKHGDARSFYIHGNDVDFPIQVLFPAPSFMGRMTSASIQGDRLVQIFGVVKPFAPAPVPAEHYIYFRGGALAFGRLSMQGVDLELLDKDADKEFEFSLQNVFQQILPGYLKPQADHGMVGYIESYRDSEEAKGESAAGNDRH